MCDAQGWDISIQHLAKKLSNILGSMKPNYAFSIVGERRAGRSTVFQNLAKLINNSNKDIICIVGELEQPNLSNLTDTLIHMAKELGDDNTLTRFDNIPKNVQGFFDFISRVSSLSGKKPILLIDMGKAMEDSSDAEAMAVAQYLKPIVNMMDDRGIPFILGLGWTRKFFDGIISISGDVYRDRYRAELFLGMAYESDSPYDIFRQIVKKISSVHLPDDYAGLLRIPGMTPAKFGENLLNQGISEISKPGDLWNMLKGKWQLIDCLSFPGLNLSMDDLACLLLADGAIEMKKTPEYLESISKGGFIANDALYEKFGILPPKRDPSALERLRNRMRDIEEYDLLSDILTPISQSLTKIGAEPIEGPCYFSQAKDENQPVERTAFLSMQIKDLPFSNNSMNSSHKIKIEFDKKVFPHRFSIGLYLDDPSQQEFEEKIIAACENDDILLILYSPLASEFGRTPLGRRFKAKAEPDYVLSEENILEIISEHTVEDRKIQMILDWLYDSLERHLTKRAVFPLLSENAKKIMSAIIANGGSISSEDLKKNLHIDNAELKALLTRLSDAEFIEKKKDMISWNLILDPIISLILRGKTDRELIEKEISNRFSLPQKSFDLHDLLSPYTGIFDGKDLECYDENDLINWYVPSRMTLLKIIHTKLDKEQEISSKFRDEFERLNNNEINEWESIPGDRSTIEELDKEIDNELGLIEKSREEEKARLEEKKSELRELIAKNGDCFSKTESDEFDKTIEGFRKSDSEGIKLLRGRLNKRIQEHKNCSLKLNSLIVKSQKLKTSNKIIDETRDIQHSIDRLSDLLKCLDFTEFNKLAVDIDKSIEELDRIRRQEEILGEIGIAEPRPNYGTNDVQSLSAPREDIPQPPGGTGGSIPQPPVRMGGSIPQPPVRTGGSIPQPPVRIGGSIPQPPVRMGGSIPQPPVRIGGSIPQPPEGIKENIPQTNVRIGEDMPQSPIRIGERMPQPPEGTAGGISQPPGGTGKSIPQPPVKKEGVTPPPDIDLWKEDSHTYDLNIKDDCLMLAELIVNKDIVISKITLEKS
ncbi:MAG: hypothetical protein AB2L14_04020 [Candidatus Xenobiia bacterium LiM19]